MEFYISLFGKKESILGWLELFEQEKLPFKYKGDVLKEFSLVNILVGLEPPAKIKDFKDDKTVFISESLNASKKEKKGKIEQKENFLIIQKNILSLLIRNKQNRSKILDILKDILLKAFGLIRLPYIHIWYYPQPCKTVFLFRQDVDYVDEKGIENLINVTSRFNIKGTYFVNISGEEEFDEEIGHLKLPKPTTPNRKETLFKLINQNNEIANHGYWLCVLKILKTILKTLRNVAGIYINFLMLKLRFCISWKRLE